MSGPVIQADVSIPMRPIVVTGKLTVPDRARGAVLFAPGRRGGDAGARDAAVVEALQRARLATFLPTLLMPAEEEVDERTRLSPFDLHLVAGRLVVATDWVRQQEGLRDAAIGYFAAGSGAAVAVVAASERPSAVKALVLVGGDPDLAGAARATVAAPTLILPAANPADTARLVCDWFDRFLTAPAEEARGAVSP